MYAPNTNVAVPAEGIWDLYGLTFEEIYTYGMNNDIVVTDGTITMPHRCADYNVTIQNANIKPTNHPTMLYPLLVNENKPIVGTIDYSDYQGDDLSYAMAYANKSEVDISIPNNVALNSQYFYNVDNESEYEYNNPRTIAKYTCNAKGVVPTFNSGYTAYKVAERDNGDGTYTTSIIADDINILPTSISFANQSALLTVDYLNTINADDLAGMFTQCKSLTSVYPFEITNKVKSMNGAFYNCNKLTSLDVSNWDTSNIWDMRAMFQYCASLTSLDVSNWDTSSVSNMGSIFQNCSSLTSLNVSNWKTSSVTSMYAMFQNCTSLTSLDVSKWDTSSVTTMSNMFFGCSSLIDINLSGFVKNKVDNLSSMFANCKSLQHITMDNWDTSSVTKLRGVFANTSLLESLDLSGWNTSKVTDMYLTFSGCTNLKTLNLNNWDTSKVTVTDNMFASCSKLTSLSWTNWKVEVRLSGSTALTAECLSNLLANLATVTDGQTLTLGSTNLDKLTDEDKATAINKGWTLA